jgi:hypothetical protein
VRAEQGGGNQLAEGKEVNNPHCKAVVFPRVCWIRFVEQRKASPLVEEGRQIRRFVVVVWSEVHSLNQEVHLLNNEVHLSTEEVHLLHEEVRLLNE